MTEPINSKLEQLNLFENDLIDLSKQMMESGQDMFALDMLAVGVINRSLSLISGFITLIRNSNYLAGVHLIRLHLDNYLRFSASWLVDEPHDFAMKVMDGTRIEKLKDRNGEVMRDKYLVKLASVEYPWIQTVYDETSGFIHLSRKHIFTSTIIKVEEVTTMEFRISKEDKYVQDESRLEAVQCMIEITRCIISLLEGWVWTKRNPDKLDELKSRKID